MTSIEIRFRSAPILRHVVNFSIAHPATLVYLAGNTALILKAKYIFYKTISAKKRERNEKSFTGTTLRSCALTSAIMIVIKL